MNFQPLLSPIPKSSVFPDYNYHIYSDHTVLQSLVQSLVKSITNISQF